MIYIAQPPLYEVAVKGQRKSEYIINEGEMRRRMIARGLEGTELVIRDGKSGKKGKDKQPRQVGAKELGELVKMLVEAERNIAVLTRRGINFAEFVGAYYSPRKGGLPRFRICIEDHEEVYYELDDYEKRVDELKERAKGAEESVVAEELHEVGRINQINDKLRKQFGLDLEDFLLKAAKDVSGEALTTKFQLASGQDKYEIASLGEICSAIRQIGGKGIEIKRFKGLGEMNAEQLWETTMNPQTRILLSVRLDDAGEADRLFSILMGDDVEERRNFIREHALEVQNLDV
jgi:DNA gyrase subunit B